MKRGFLVLGVFVLCMGFGLAASGTSCTNAASQTIIDQYSGYTFFNSSQGVVYTQVKVANYTIAGVNLSVVATKNGVQTIYYKEFFTEIGPYFVRALNLSNPGLVGASEVRIDISPILLVNGSYISCSIASTVILVVNIPPTPVPASYCNGYTCILYEGGAATSIINSTNYTFSINSVSSTQTVIKAISSRWGYSLITTLLSEGASYRFYDGLTVYIQDIQYSSKDTGYSSVQMSFYFNTSTTPSNLTCFDSDGGLDYYVKGNASKGGSLYSDNCVGNILMEAKCYNNAPSIYNYTCPYGCSNGACIKSNATLGKVAVIVNGSWDVHPISLTTATQIAAYLGSKGIESYIYKSTELDSVGIVPPFIYYNFYDSSKGDLVFIYSPSTPANLMVGDEVKSLVTSIPQPVSCYNSALINSSTNLSRYLFCNNITPPQTCSCPAPSTELYCNMSNACYKDKSYSCNGTQCIETVKWNCASCSQGCSEGKCVQSNNTTSNGTLDFNVSIVDPEDLCEGCMIGEKCYSMGYRKSGKYCSDNQSFIEYKGTNTVCDNNFECASNLCTGERCVSGGLLKSMLNWFKRVFTRE